MSYAVISDLHLHKWSAFSQTNADGMNSRLDILIKEIKRVADAAYAQGAANLFVAGDVFHVRGQIAPSVLNPAKEMFEYVAGIMDVHILTGNHDLEGRHTNALGSAVQSLSNSHFNIHCYSEKTVTVATGVGIVGMVPWIENLEDLKAEILLAVKRCDDLIIHAPINGVIKGIPDTGLDPLWLDSLPIRNIFSGHYHNHKKFGQKTYSIGAIAHHSWSDLGSQAGSLIVSTGGAVEFRAAHTPSFVELDAGMSESDMELAADGNYVRVKLNTSKASDIQDIRDSLIEAGALGVMVIAEPKAKVAERSEASKVNTKQTLPQIISSYVDPTGTDFQRQLVAKTCLEVLAAVEAV